VSNLAFGPDGMLYVRQAVRATDGGGGARGRRSIISKVAEVETTAWCVWRLDPKSEHPGRSEVYARGIRNPVTALRGMVTEGCSRFANGARITGAPEEMDFIRQGRHYGFPYQFFQLAGEARLSVSAHAAARRRGVDLHTAGD